MGRRIVLATALAVLLAGAAAGQAGAGGAGPYAPKDCTKPRIEPHSIVISCSDAGLFVKHIDWDEWTFDGADGDGTLVANTCRPTCEAGNFKRYPVDIQLAKVKVKKCGGAEVPLFRRAFLHFPDGHPDFPGIHEAKLFCVPSGDGL